MTVSRAVEVRVNQSGLLPFDPISPLNLNIGVYYQSDPFPAASGGVPPYTYAFTCAGGEALPDGMSFDPETRVFAGIPTSSSMNPAHTRLPTVPIRPRRSRLAVEVLVDPLDGEVWRFRTRDGRAGRAVLLTQPRRYHTGRNIAPRAGRNSGP